MTTIIPSSLSSSSSSSLIPIYHYPILGSIFGIITILIVYFTTRQYNRLPTGVITPPISLLGCNTPEHEIYQIGFTITGLLLLKSITYWKQLILLPSFSDNRKIASFLMVIGSYMSVFGVIGQGIVTLEEDFLHKVVKLHLPISQQSMIHQILALVFFVGSAIHCYTTIYVSLFVLRTTTTTTNQQATTIGEVDSTSSTSTSTQPPPISTSTSSSSSNKRRIYSNISIIIKIICCITSLISWPIAELLHPLNYSGENNNKRGFNIGGLAQYITVISYIVFFGSYSLDFYNLIHKNQNRKEQQQLEQRNDKNK